MADSKLLNPSNSASPPPNCAICLGSCSNKCFSDTCMHQFCFKCLLQWSKIKAECPLCKQPFKSIIHNVKSNEEYEEHIVEEPRPIHIIDNEQYLILPQSPPSSSRHQHRFHFRTTFTVNTHGENAIQQMLLSHSLTNGISISNYLPGSWPQYNRRTRRDITTTTSFRRSIYNNNLWASSPMNTSVDGRFREVTPEFFQTNPASRTRLAPWLNRELNALLHENTQDVMQLVDTIMDYLLRYHICSRSFRNLLQTYLGERTDHFVHEFYNFMRSPFDMIGYDRHVIYMERPSTPTPLIDLSEDDSSDVMIVEEDPIVIEVSSNDSDVIMTSFPNEMPKPQLLPTRRRSRKRSRYTRLSSSSSSDRELHRKEERSKRRKKRKIANNEKCTRTKSFKLADFVMEDSSSSELDDLPLAKYLRIKASIGKKILKNSHPTDHKRSADKKLKVYKKSINCKSKKHSRKQNLKMPKFVDLSSPMSPQAHCSKYTPQRRDSSSSSSTSSSSSWDRSDPSRNSIPSTVSSRNTSCFEKFPVHDQNEEQENQTLDLSFACMNNKSMVGSLDLDKTKEKYDQGTVRTDEHLYGTHNSRYSCQNTVWSDEPGMSYVKDKSKAQIGVEPLKLRIKSKQQCSSRQQNTKCDSLGLVNHFIYSPPRLDAFNSSEQDNNIYNISPFMMNSQTSVQSNNFYNTSQHDLIDLSMSRMKTESVPDPYFVANPNSNSNSNSSIIDAPQKEILPNSKNDDGNIFDCPYQLQPKLEPPLPEYNPEGFNRYWTDFATTSSSFNNSSDPCFNTYPEFSSRKSVIQNVNGNREYSNPYIDAASQACNPEYWSDSSD